MRDVLATPGHSSENRPGTLANSCLSGRLGSTRVHGFIDSLTSPEIRKSDDPSPKGRHFRAAHEAPRSLARCRYPPQPDAILPPAIEPDYRGCEHLVYGMHISIVGAPRFHILRMHGVDQIIVASRPSRVVVLARRILDEQAIQSVIDQ
jgi:hypothetical protein